MAAEGLRRADGGNIISGRPEKCSYLTICYTSGIKISIIVLSKQLFGLCFGVGVSVMGEDVVCIADATVERNVVLGSRKDDRHWGDRTEE